MSTLTLRLELLSDTAFGRGEGRAGSVDRDVPHDGHGLPRVSGRTLKGLLRDAYVEVTEMLDASGISRASLASVGALFGLPGQPQSGSLQVSDLNVPDANDIRAHIDHARYHDAAALLDPEQVLSSFTVVRAQTAIDGELGTFRAGSLRTTRVLRRRTVLEARIEITEDAEGSQARGLALACLGLRRVGVGRTRGLGRCRAHLFAGGQELTSPIAHQWLMEAAHTGAKDQ